MLKVRVDLVAVLDLGVEVFGEDFDIRKQLSDVLGQTLMRQEDRIVGKMYRAVGLQCWSERRSPFKKTAAE